MTQSLKMHSRHFISICCLLILLVLSGCDCAEDSNSAFGPECSDEVVLGATEETTLGEEETAVLGSGNLIFSDVGDASIRVLENFATAEGETATQLPLSGNNTGLTRPQNISISPTNQGLIVPDEGDSAVYFFDDTSDLSGNQFPSRILRGAATEMLAPVHAVVDAASDELYVLDRGSNRIFVFANASTIDGDLAPTRTIGGATAAFENPAAILLLPSTNRLVVIAPSEIFTFENMDTLNGDPAPIGRVGGANTTFRNLIYGRLTSEGTFILADQGSSSILFFENFQFDQNNAAPTRTLSGSNTGIQRAGQFALSSGELYLANGTDILVFDDLGSIQGNPFPIRRIRPTNPPATTVRGLAI